MCLRAKERVRVMVKNRNGATLMGHTKKNGANSWEQREYVFGSTVIGYP